MGNSTYLPSLSELGWCNGSEAIADGLLSHFFTAFYSQSYIFKDQVSSLQYLIQKNLNNITSLTSDVQSTLSNYFSRYFTDVVVEVKEKADATNSSQQAITIFMTFTDSDGSTYNLSDLVTFGNGTIQKIIKLNNG